MIEYIKGTLTYSSPLKTVIEVGHIGYKLQIPFNNYSKLPSLGEMVCLYLSTVIREDSHKHFGFLTVEERDLFELLLDVSGIGPKTALALLGHLEAIDLQLAISKSDVTGICKVPGIGKKTAERLIVEMRDRFQKGGQTLLPSASSKKEGSLSEDALSALINLGYPPPQAQKALQLVLGEEKETPDISRLITLALRKL